MLNIVFVLCNIDIAFTAFPPDFKPADITSSVFGVCLGHFRRTMDLKNLFGWCCWSTKFVGILQPLLAYILMITVSSLYKLIHQWSVYMCCVKKKCEYLERRSLAINLYTVSGVFEKCIFLCDLTGSFVYVHWRFLGKMYKIGDFFDCVLVLVRWK